MEDVKEESVVEAENTGVVDTEGPVVDAEVVDQETDSQEEYKLEPIQPEDQSKFTKEELEVYESALILQNHPDADIFAYWRQTGKCKDLLKLVDDVADKDKAEQKNSVKDMVDIRATEMAMKLEYEKIQKKVKAAMPEEFAKSYFHTNDILYGVIPDDEGKIHPINDPKTTEIYLKALEIADLLAMLDDEKFIHKVIKDIKAVRFRRHADRVNFFLKQYYRNKSLKENSAVIDCNQSVTHIMKSFKKRNEVTPFTEEIVKGYFIALSELTKTWEPYNLFNAEYVYLCNMNAIVSTVADKDEENPTASEAKFCHNISLFFQKLEMKLEEYYDTHSVCKQSL